jgi:hypothetical protein
MQVPFAFKGTVAQDFFLFCESAATETFIKNKMFR